MDRVFTNAALTAEQHINVVAGYGKAHLFGGSVNYISVDHILYFLVLKSSLLHYSQKVLCHSSPLGCNNQQRKGGFFIVACLFWQLQK